MDDGQAQFERELRRGLQDLADRAPAGDGIEGVRRRLRRRALRRTAAGAAAGMAAVLMVTAWVGPWQPPGHAPATAQEHGTRLLASGSTAEGGCATTSTDTLADASGSLTATTIAEGGRATQDPAGVAPGQERSSSARGDGVELVAAPLPEPIPADAGAAQIQAAVFGYLASVGAHGQVLVCKEPGNPLYFAVGGDIRVRPEQLHDSLATMFQHFAAVSIERRGRDVRCTLVAASPASSTGRWQEHKEHV